MLYGKYENVLAVGDYNLLLSNQWDNLGCKQENFKSAQWPFLKSCRNYLISLIHIGGLLGKLISAN